MWSSKRSAASAHIRRLCTLGLPMEGVVPALIRALCREAHCDAGVVLWFDAHGEIANLYAQNLPAPAAIAAWFLPRPDAGTAVRQPLAVEAPTQRSAFVEICADDDEHRPTEGRPEPFCPHRHLCGMATPGGAPVQRLCSAVVRHGTAVASLMLYRPARAPAFSRDERAAVKAAGRYLSLGCAVAPVDTGAAMYRASGEQAFLLCEADGRVVKASANGYTLLAQASGCAISRSTVPEALERAGRQLVRHLFAEDAHDAQRRHAGRAGPTATLTNPWGLFRLRVFFEPNGVQGLLIERVEHLLVRLVTAMWHLDLSVQQGEVLLLLAQGLSHERISERMGVSPNTADYHIRQLYAKLGAHTRNEAIADALVALESADAA
jgi:DNA-binding CsgD family transcriptional regulator